MKISNLAATIVFAFVLCRALSAQNACLGEWAYVRTVNINNVTASTLSDFQIRVTFDSQALIAAGKMNADGSDLRFTAGDCCTELALWIQSGLNTPVTRAWVRVPFVPPSGSQQIRMYYGNPNAPTVQHIDSVMFSMGNDLMGTDPLPSDVTITTQRDTFPIDVRTVRFKIYSQDTAAFKLKVANDTNMVTGTSPYFTTPSTPGFYTYDWEGLAVAGGFPGFYTPDTLRIMNACAPALPCPGSCGDLTYAPNDLVVFGALDSVTCGSYPSLRTWYRKSIFFDPFTSLQAEFFRKPQFDQTVTGSTQLCPGDSVRLTVRGLPGALSYQWFLDANPIPGATDTSIVTMVEGAHFCVANFGICWDVMSDTTYVTVDTPAVELGADYTLCSDTGVTLDAGPGYASYLWSDGSTGATLYIDTTGTYWVDVTDTNGCSISDTVRITLHPLPIPDVVPSGPLSFCPGDSVRLDAYNAAWFAYLWNFNGSTSSSILITQPGSFFVVVYDSNGCSDTSDVLTVALFPEPMLDLGPDTAFCAGDSVLLDAGPDWASITWSGGSQQQTFTVTFSGGFVAVVVDTNACMDTDTVYAQMNPIPTPLLGPDQIICPGTTYPLDGGGGYAFYAWNSGESTQTIAAAGGTYSVLVTDTAGCVGASDTVTIEEYPAIPTPTIVGNEDQLASSAAPNYQWLRDGVPIANATAQTYNPDTSGAYSVMVVDPNGCDTTYSNSITIDLNVIVTIDADDIPEGFSPNGDGINDNFAILGITQFPSNSLQVINRWGQAVYSRKPYDNSFNGNSDQGVELPDGTYFYILDLGNGDKPFSGYLILNR